MKNTKIIIIVTLIIVLLAMAVGYSAFSTQLSLNGSAEIVGVWDVKITNISVQSASKTSDPGSPQFTNTTATFDAKLEKPTDTITYLITIKNEGTTDAKLNSITLTADEEHGSPAIIYSNTTPANELKAGQETSFTVSVSYDEDYLEVPSITTKTITGVIEYVQK